MIHLSPSENCLKPQKSGSKWLPRRSHPLPEAACQLSRRSIFHSPTQSDRSSRSAGALVQILINFLLLMISLICWSKWLPISSQFLNFECCCVCLPSIAWWEHFTCSLISKLIGSWQQKLIFCTESQIESAVDCDYSTRKKINQISSKILHWIYKKKKLRKQAIKPHKSQSLGFGFLWGKYVAS